MTGKGSDIGHSSEDGSMHVYQQQELKHSVRGLVVLVVMQQVLMMSMVKEQQQEQLG